MSLTAAFALPLCAQPDETTLAASAPSIPAEPILTIEAGLHAGSLRSMATDEANRFLVTGSSDKTVRIWELSSGNLLGVLRPPVGKGGDGAIMAVAITPDGSTVACGGRTRGFGKNTQHLPLRPGEPPHAPAGFWGYPRASAT